MPAWDGAEVMRLFRERLLARLALRHAISEELVQKLFVYLDGHKAVLYRSRMNPESKPPPEVAEVVRVPPDDEGREIGITG
jgi:hypothetical protein